ncbi:nucleolar complex-associated protein-domain-containing protein [Delphinella strobiligena]|nr:nucleolar complex-associated protein-domain-containing protein [Delphinella strobiligena]
MAPITKRRKLSPPGEDKVNGGKSNDAKPTDGFYSRASKWNLEQDYENRPRKLNKKDKKEGGRLPIKTAEGWVEQKEAPPAEPTPKEDDAAHEHDSFLGSGDEDEDAEEDVEEEEQKPQIPIKQQILAAKEELARVAGNISEDPEEHIGQLKNLSALGDSRVPAIKKLAMAAQLAVYKDIVPGYRIRPLTEEDMRTKLSKDIRKLRNFEQALLGGYHDYIKDLGKAAKHSGDFSKDAKAKDRAGIASVAITCACTLLNTLPHFNFRDNLLGIIVGKLSTKQLDQDFAKCRESIETLFRDDEDGNASLMTVQMLTRMMKSRNYNIHESVLNTFLHLRLLSEFLHKASTNRIDKRSDDEPKMKKKDREYRSKKERKRAKELKVVEKEMVEADAVVSHEERDKYQSEMLKLVFVAYFRILKARIPTLMGAVLEGLARYAHLINQDFFGDILEALRDMISTAESNPQDGGQDDEDDDEEDEEEADSKPRNLNRESLLCIITAFALLQGQQDVVKQANSLSLDLDFFITHLYRTLLPSSLNPDIELGANSLRLSDPHTGEGGNNTPTSTGSDGKKHKVNIQTTTVLLLRSLSSTLLPPTATRSVPPLRIAAFTKTLLTASLQLPEKSCLAMLGLLHQVMRVQGKKISALWYTEERKGDGVWKGDTREVEGGNPFAATIWEGELLRLHFAPKVREGVRGLEKMVVSSRS